MRQHDVDHTHAHGTSYYHHPLSPSSPPPRQCRGDWPSGPPDGAGGDAGGFMATAFTSRSSVSADDLQLMLLGLLEQNPQSRL